MALFIYLLAKAYRHWQNKASRRLLDTVEPVGSGLVISFSTPDHRDLPGELRGKFKPEKILGGEKHTGSLVLKAKKNGSNEEVAIKIIHATSIWGFGKDVQEKLQCEVVFISFCPLAC